MLHKQGRWRLSCVMVITQLVHSFNYRSTRLSLFQVGAGIDRARLLAFVLSLGLQVAALMVPVAVPVFKVAPSLPIEDWVLMGPWAF